MTTLTRPPLLPSLSFSSSSSSSTTSLLLTPSPELTPLSLPNTPTLLLPLKTHLLQPLPLLPPSRPLTLVGLLASPDPGSALYAQMTGRTIQRLAPRGEVVWEVEELPEGGRGYEDVVEAIGGLNEREGVDGFIVYFPLFGLEKDAHLRSLISPSKDIESLHPTSLSLSYLSPPPLFSLPPAPAPAASYFKHPGGRGGGGSYFPVQEMGEQVGFGVSIRGLQTEEMTMEKTVKKEKVEKKPQHEYKNGEDEEERIYPCTPAGIYTILRGVPGLFDPPSEGEGRIGIIVNRSEIVGAPLASMLANTSFTILSLDLNSLHLLHPTHLPLPACLSSLPRSPAQLSPSGRYTTSSIPHPPDLETLLGMIKPDLLISGVPGGFKVQTGWVGKGCLVVDFSTGGNFEADIGEPGARLEDGREGWEGGGFLGKVGGGTILWMLRNGLVLRRRADRRRK